MAFVELHKLDGAKVAVNPAHILYAADSGDGHTFFHYGLLHGTFVEVAEDFETIVAMLNHPKSKG